MTPGAWVGLGIVAGMLIERTLVWLEHRLAQYQRKLRVRRELDEFWSER